MKKFIMCIIVIFMCSTLDASIDYKHRYEVSYKQRSRKSFRKIIREIINKRKIEQKPNMNQIIPIPLYDSVEPNLLKDLA